MIFRRDKCIQLNEDYVGKQACNIDEIWVQPNIHMSAKPNICQQNPLKKI